MVKRDVNITIKARDQASKVMNKTAKSTDRLNKSLSRAGGFFGASSKGARSATESNALLLVSLKKIAIALTAAFGVRAIQKNVSSTLALVDSTTKVASRLGIATDKLVGLRHAAELTGVAQTTLDMALQRMTRRLSEAAKGTGESVKALKELGINAKEIVDLPLEEQFKTIADRMNLVERQSDKVRLSFKLFDSEGVALVNTLKLGSEGLGEMQKEVESLGVAFSDLTGRRIVETNKSLLRLKLAIRGISISLADQLSPVIDGVSQKLVGMANNGRKAGNGLIDVFEGVTSTMGFVGDTVHGVKTAYEELLLVQLSVEQQIAKGFEKTESLAGKAAEKIAQTLFFIKTGTLFELDMALNKEKTGIEKWSESITKIVTKQFKKVAGLLFDVDLPSEKVKRFFDKIRADIGPAVVVPDGADGAAGADGRDVRQQLRAQESRRLTFAPGARITPEETTAKNTTKMVKLLDFLVKDQPKFDDLLRAIAPKAAGPVMVSDLAI